ncbi:MAG: hypothetical protein ABSB79_02335 [Syntrophales bacterium]|jgi:hypothetical protein
MLEHTLDKMAEKILGLDEASMSSLWEKYKKRMEKFDTSREWEKSVIIFFIINAVRAKNYIFNDQIIKKQAVPNHPETPRKKKPNLHRIK